MRGLQKYLEPANKLMRLDQVVYLDQKTFYLCPSTGFYAWGLSNDEERQRFGGPAKKDVLRTHPLSTVGATVCACCATACANSSEARVVAGSLQRVEDLLLRSCQPIGGRRAHPADVRHSRQGVEDNVAGG
jgi:hypothetical protein